MTKIKRSDFDKKALSHAIAEIEDQISAADMTKLREIKLMLGKLQDLLLDNVRALSDGSCH